MSEIRYNFIVPQMTSFPLAELENGNSNGVPLLFSRGEFIWGLQTYQNLKNLGLPVKLSFELDSEAINLAHGNVLRSLDKRFDYFCVSLQADFPHFQLAQYHIVQNQEQVAQNASFIPHWPQPGQIARDPNRNGVRKVAYQGARRFTDLDERRLNSDLKKHDISFEILDEKNWPHLLGVDVLVGIRSFSNIKYKRKPPTKLIDAWHAGIPFVGGWDSAYTQIGDPGEDYLRVSSYEEFLDCIVRLKDDQELYNRLVAAGRKKASSYTIDAIAQQWENILESDIRIKYDEWKKASAKQWKYMLMRRAYALDEFQKTAAQRLYRIPGLKRLRDRYYDPVK